MTPISQLIAPPGLPGTLAWAADWMSGLGGPAPRAESTMRPVGISYAGGPPTRLPFGPAVEVTFSPAAAALASRQSAWRQAIENS